LTHTVFRQKLLHNVTSIKAPCRSHQQRVAEFQFGGWTWVEGKHFQFNIIFPD